MRLKFAITACAAALLLPVVAIYAGSSLVVDGRMRGDKQLLRLLLLQESDVDSAQADGSTAIQWPADTNELEMADLLMAAVAKVEREQRDDAPRLNLGPI